MTPDIQHIQQYYLEMHMKRSDLDLYIGKQVFKVNLSDFIKCNLRAKTCILTFVNIQY